MALRAPQYTSKGLVGRIGVGSAVGSSGTLVALNSRSPDVRRCRTRGRSGDESLVSASHRGHTTSGEAAV